MSRTRLQRLFVLFVSLALLALSGLAAAQAPVEPVILNIDGDLWAWEGAGQPLTQLTDWGHNHNPVMSPDGTRIAYTSYASIFVDWLRTVQGAGGFLPPENIWILDVPSRQTFRIADQPANAAYNGPEQEGSYTMRQELIWSPDGGRVAWIEIRATPASFGADQYTNWTGIVVYDLASRATLVVDSFTVTGVSPRTGVDRYGLGWNESGIVLEMRPAQFSGEAASYRLYDLMGGIFKEMTSTASGYTDAIYHNGQEYLFDPRNPETLLHGQTGEAVALANTVEMYSLTAPDGAYFSSADGDSWTLNLPGQSPVELGDDVQPYGISRDGAAALYSRYEIDSATGFYAYTVVSHSAAGAVEIGRYDNVEALSGPVGWRVRP